MTDIIIFHLAELINGGYLADGVMFSNGKCVMMWCGDVNSIVIHETMEDLIKIHCHDDIDVIYPI